MNKILNDAVCSTRLSFQEKELKIDIDSFMKEIKVEANELLLEVFENILINATKFNDNPNVEIMIKISKEQKNNIKYIKLEFIDNGIGIPDNIKESVFLRGFKKKKRSIGLGLGLSLVKKVIDKYNGQIWVENKVEEDYTKGSNFVILIPEAI